MTLTETRPEQQSPAAQPADAGSLLTTSDHRTVGSVFMAGALLFLLVAGVVGAVLRGELAEPGVSLVGDDYLRLFSLHATAAAVLFLGPFWLGLATVLVPAQIGSDRLAFPRLQATAAWVFVAGGVLTLASYASGDGPAAGGLTFSTPTLSGTREATDLWLGGLALVALATLIASINLLATVLKLRRPGLRIGAVPMFTWSVVCASAILLLSTPVHLGGLALLFVDAHFGGSLFATAGSGVVWQHLLWLFGRPEIFLLTLPALGVASDIVAAHSRRPLFAEPAARVAMAAFAVLSLGSWAAGNRVADALVLPTYSPLTTLVAAPLGILVLLWLATLRFGTPRFHLSLAFVGGFVALLGFGAANAGIAALTDGVGSAWTNAHLHVVAFGAPMLLAAAALHHWAPRIWGRALPAGSAALHALVLTGGFLLLGLGGYLLGYDGGPWHVDDLDKSSWTNFSRLAAAGGLVVVAGVLAVAFSVINVARGKGEAAPADPYEAGRDEWIEAVTPPRSRLLPTGAYLFGTAAIALFGGLLAAYIQLRHATPGGFPSGELEVDNYLGGTMLVTVLLSALTAEWFAWGVRTGNRRQAMAAGGITLGFGLAWANLLWYALAQAGFGPATAPYGVLFFTILGLAAALVAVSVGFAAINLVRFAGNQVTTLDPDGVRAATLFWHLVGASWLVASLAIYVFQHK
jgi:cytochrome c oxidase subunit I